MHRRVPVVIVNRGDTFVCWQRDLFIYSEILSWTRGRFLFAAYSHARTHTHLNTHTQSHNYTHIYIYTCKNFNLPCLNNFHKLLIPIPIPILSLSFHPSSYPPPYQLTPARTRNAGYIPHIRPSSARGEEVPRLWIPRCHGNPGTNRCRSGLYFGA